MQHPSRFTLNLIAFYETQKDLEPLLLWSRNPLYAGIRLRDERYAISSVLLKPKHIDSTLL
jgi:hypothetical protein